MTESDLTRSFFVRLNAGTESAAVELDCSEAIVRMKLDRIRDRLRRLLPDDSGR